MFKWIKILFGPRTQYLALMAKDQEEKDKSKKLGIQSLILSILGAVIMIAIVAIATVLAQNINESLAGNYSFPVMSLFGAIVFYAFAFIGVNVVVKFHFVCKFSAKNKQAYNWQGRFDC